MITITNKNIYHSDFSLSDISDLNKVGNVHIGDIINFLSDVVELGESVTFKRLFDIVAYNVDKFNEIFYSSLGGYPLEPFLQEIENIPTEIIDSDYLEIHWFCDKYENELNISPSMHGLSTKTTDSYALDFVSLNNIKNCVVKINKNVSIFDFNSIKNEDIIDKVDELIDNIKTKDRLELGEKLFSLFDIYDAIFDEISFHGGPQDKKEKFEELEEQIDEVKEGIKEDSKDSMTFQEMLDKIESKDKYLVKYNEQRDRVDKHRMSNKKNLSKLKNCLIEKLKIYDLIENSDENLEQYYKKLTDIEYNMQLLYGEEEDISKHLFWHTPKCTCPKIDNIEIYPSKNPIFDNKCPIHKKTS
jgi:ribosomal protein S15P/S13E